MKTIDKLILIGGGLVCGLTVSAQQHKSDSTVNRTVVVENEYNPNVMDAYKVNVLPKVEEPAVPKKQIDYATTSHSLLSYPIVSMYSITRDISQDKAKKGYARIAYGNRNNTDIKAAYLWDITTRDRLDVMASFYGYSGTVSSGYDFNGNDLPVLDSDKEWKHRFFRTDASAVYSHEFDKVKMSIGGDIASQVFAYMPDISVSGNVEEKPSYGHQHFTTGGGYIGFVSAKDVLPVDFSFKVGFRGFGRKHMIASAGKISEQNVYIKGDVSGRINDSQSVGIDLSVDNMLYGEIFKKYSLVKFNPYYSLNNDYVSLRAGLNLDFQTGYSSGMKISPDVRFDYIFSDSYVLYANLTGSTRLNDFYALNNQSPFWIQLGQQKTSYTPVDIRVGFKASPVDGFGLNLYGGYRETRDELFSMPYAEDGGGFSCFAQEKAKVGYAGFSMDYSYRDRFGFGMNMNYYSWSVKEGYDALLWLKPEYSLGFNVGAKVINGLTASLEYKYEGRNNVSGMRADAVNELNIGAEYSLKHRFNVFIGINNLLNKNYISETAYPVQGLNVLAGLSVNF